MKSASVVEGKKGKKTKKPDRPVDSRTRKVAFQVSSRAARSAEIHRMIPIAGFASSDFHVVMTTRGDLVALWETEGIDSSCLSKEQIEDHHRLITQAMNESDRRLMIHTYFIKDRVPYDGNTHFAYRDEVVNGIDGAQHAALAGQEFYSTRIVYCLEWSTPFVVAGTWIQKLKPMLADIFMSFKADARERLKNRIAFMLGMDDPAVEAAEKDLLLESQEFMDASDAFFTRLGRIRLGDSIDKSAAEGIGAASVEVTKLCGVDAYDFYSRLWNWDQMPSPFLPSVNHLAHYIGSKNPIDFGRHADVVMSGDAPVAIYTVRAFRDPVDYDVFRHFRNIQAEMVIHTRYMPMGVDASSKFLSDKLTVAHRMGGWTKGDPLRKQRLEELEKAMHSSVRGEPFGYYSAAVMISGDNHEDLRLKRRLLELAAYTAGIVLQRESMNLDFSWLSFWPNNHVFEFHRLAAQSSLAAGAMMPYRMPEGYGKRPPSGQVFSEPLCTLNSWSLEGGMGAPTRVWIGVSDLNHFLVTGRSGGGKSFLVNFLETNWGRYGGTKDKPVGLVRWIIDRGHSYKPLCEVMGGAYLNVGDPASPAKMNPLDLSSDEIRRDIDKLVPFICTLMAATATMKVEFSEMHTLAIGRALNEMATDMTRLNRRGSIAFFAQALKGNNELFERLRPWIPASEGGGGGDFAHIFPDEADGFASNDFVVFNFSDEFVGPSTEGPIMSYILMKLNRFVMNPKNEGVHKFLFIDELAIAVTPKPDDWKSAFITGALRSTIRKALKEWRKAGGAIGMATQEPRDLLFDRDLFETVRGGAPTRIYLPQDPSKALMDKDDGLGLDDHLANSLRDLPKGVFLVEQRGMRRFLQLKADPTSYAVWTTDPAERAFRKGYLDTHPITEDNPALKVFAEIGRHIQDARESGNSVRYLNNLQC